EHDGRAAGKQHDQNGDNHEIGQLQHGKHGAPPTTLTMKDRSAVWRQDIMYFAGRSRAFVDARRLLTPGSDVKATPAAVRFRNLDSPPNWAVGEAVAFAGPPLWDGRTSTKHRSLLHRSSSVIVFRIADHRVDVVGAALRGVFDHYRRALYPKIRRAS